MVRYVKVEPRKEEIERAEKLLREVRDLIVDITEDHIKRYNITIDQARMRMMMLALCFIHDLAELILNLQKRWIEQLAKRAEEEKAKKEKPEYIG